MISSVLIGIAKFVLELVSMVLTPMVSAVSQNVPALAQLLNLLNSFIDLILTFFPWLLSWLNIPGYVLTFSCDILINIITLKVMFHGIKVAVAWWHKLKI